MSDQQKPSGEWEATDGASQESQSASAGLPESDQTLTQPILGSAEDDPVVDQAQHGEAPPSRESHDATASPASEPTHTPAAGDAAPVWRDQYLKERKNSRLFMATTVVAVVLLVGSLFYAAGQDNSTQPADLVAGRGPGGTVLEDGRGPGSAPPRGERAPGRQDLSMERLFNADGSVDEELIESLKARAERFGGVGRFSDRIAAGIAGAVASGEITQEQADELMATLDLDSSSDGV